MAEEKESHPFAHACVHRACRAACVALDSLRPAGLALGCRVSLQPTGVIFGAGISFRRLSFVLA
jgi:hypothetical protein